MRKVLIFCSMFACHLASSAAEVVCADDAARPPRWSGFYGGVVFGTDHGRFDETMSDQGKLFGDYDMPQDRRDAIDRSGRQAMHTPGFFGGIEAGYNWQWGGLVVGIEGDVQATHLAGNYASAGIRYPDAVLGDNFFIANFVNSDWMASLRPRLGYVLPNQWLVYGTAGPALAHLHSEHTLTDPGNYVGEYAHTSGLVPGFSIGAGIEAPITDRLSFKTEYLHSSFSTAHMGAPAIDDSGQAVNQSAMNHTSRLSTDLVRIGLNYRLWSPGGEGGLQRSGPEIATIPILNEFDVESGVRIGYSNGNVGSPQAFYNVIGARLQNVLISRLTYKNLAGTTGEAFLRVDHKSGLFAKGFLGAAGLYSGRAYDEDFPSEAFYTKTVAPTSAQIGYLSIDAGGKLLSEAGSSFGAFAGYFYSKQQNLPHGIRDARYYDDDNPIYGHNAVLGTNFGDLNALRLGVTSRLQLADKLRFDVEAAYLPLVHFKSEDDHIARQFYTADSAWGSGVMLEAVASYDVTPWWSIGLGARYWAVNSQTGRSTSIDWVEWGDTYVSGARFSMERYGLFAQSSIRLQGDAGAAAHPESSEPSPVRWTGVSIGGVLGGGFSDDRWADRFAGTHPPRAPDEINVPYIGDQVHATGALAGLEIGYDQQIGSSDFVVGAHAAWMKSRISGQDTCFTGLNGVDCGRSVDQIGTLGLRGGYSLGRTLLYGTAGGALVNTLYSINAQTYGIRYGTGKQNKLEGGWMVGGGFEHHLTGHWSLGAEFNHIGIPAKDKSFPSIKVIGAEPIGVKSSIDIFKTSLSYRF